ncbi:MAG TPA: glycosyltransferase family 2 protein, partial [Candidatus Woesebacteria bacterium]|nr:glycosyltransferase family 2 protein [Candidatus Woesebacteria bacterium]
NVSVMPKLSIIILSYNTRDITFASLETLINSLQKTAFNSEIIIVDNASADGSVEMLKKFDKQYETKQISITAILNKENVGFPKGNNQGIAIAKGEYILFLNSDVMVQDIEWDKILEYMDSHPKIGALTVKVELPNRELDKACHRGYPTIWNAFTYYAGLEKITYNIPLLNRLFGGYHLTHFNLNKVHKVDAISGAFFLTRKTLMDSLHGFDETFFMYGEDLDLAYRIKEFGYLIIYYPLSSVLHLKYQSGLKTGKKKTKSKTREHFFNAMKIFYKKHYEKKYPFFINSLVYFFIDFKSKVS